MADLSETSRVSDRRLAERRADPVHCPVTRAKTQIMASVEASAPVQYPTLPGGGGRLRTWSFRESGPPASPKPRLLDRVRQADLPWLDGIVRAKRPERLPVVLTREEVRAVFQWLDGVPRLMACLLYGAGLRVLECCRLRVQDIDFATNQIVVRGGKGDKDRVTMLPGIAKADLSRHLDVVRTQHQRDLAAGAGWVELPTALLKKYPNAGREPPHPAPFVRDAPARGRPRYPHRPGTAGAPGREHHHDLHPRPESRAGRGEEPGGPDVRPMTTSATLESIRIGIRRATSQPISTREGRSARTQVAGSKGRGASRRGRFQIGICCRSSQGLRYYADQPIQWPNCSSAASKQPWSRKTVDSSEWTRKASSDRQPTP